MNLKSFHKFSAIAITLVFLSVFANPTPANAGWDDILGAFGIGNGSSNSSSYYDGTAQQSDGDLELSKRARRIGRDQEYHESINVRSGELVEVRIEIKNKSNQIANTVVRDELGGSVVYVKNSLSVNGQSSAGGLTSGGLQMNIPAKSTYTIWYRINVCGASGYVTRASAYAAAIGSATDGIAITMENQNSSFYYNDVSTCLNQFQSANSGGTNSGTPAFYGNPLQGWTGVNNSTNASTSNPFTGWTGVNNNSGSASYNPFEGWSGVNNASSHIASNNPFSGWVGVNNSNGTSAVANNPFGGWSGVNNATTTSSSANPFTGWTGVNNSTNTSTSNNPFTGWSGVNNFTQTSSTTNNPFTGWSGVNNSTSTTTGSNPFAGWTGVDNGNSNVATTNSPFGSWNGVSNSTDSSITSNPFAGWNGVNNSDAARASNTNDIFGTWNGVSNSDSINNPFGDWTGVNNADGTYGNSNNTTDIFGTWNGVGNSDQTSNPFGDWYGVASTDSGFDASGYQNNNSGTGSMVLAASTDNSNSTAPRFVAPTTGVDKVAPFGFAALLTAAFIMFKKRKLLFN